MASRPDIDVTAALKLSEDHQNIIFAVKAEFDTSNILLHSGAGELTFNGEVYEGAGTLMGISDIEDSQELKSAGVTFSLSGMDTEVLGYALTENYQNRPISLWMLFMSGGTDHIVSSILIYRGRMTQINVEDNPEAGSTITVGTENRLIDLRRPSNLRYTKESQQYLYPGDTSLDGVTKLQDMEILWGRQSTSGGVAAGGGRGGIDPRDSQLR